MTEGEKKIYQQQQESSLKMYENDARRYRILIQLLNWNIEGRYLPKKIAVYGAGNIGKNF